MPEKTINKWTKNLEETLEILGEIPERAGRKGFYNN